MSKDINYERVIRAAKGAINGVDLYCCNRDLSNSEHDLRRWLWAKGASAQALRRELGVKSLPKYLYRVCIYLADCVHIYPGLDETWAKAKQILVQRLTRDSEFIEGLEEEI
jgi:hypothetical protein